jgi:hypothetical protein
MKEHPVKDKEPIAVVDAVRDGKILCTVRTEARRSGISGNLCSVQLPGQKLLCRIGTVDMSNPIHGNPAFQPLIMEQGRLPHFSRDTDIETTTLDVIACVDEATRKIAGRRSNPCSGSDVFPVSLDEIEAFRRDREFFFNVGVSPSDQSIPMSLINRHFGPSSTEDGRDLGGWDEARHTLVVGQNGSGKTVLMTSLLAAKAVAHPGMGLFIPDTAGDITNDASFGKGIEFRYSFHDLLRSGGREPVIVGIDDVRLESPLAFEEVIIPHLQNWFSMQPEKAATLAHRIPGLLEDKGLTLREVTIEQFLEVARDEVPFLYAASKSGGGGRKSDTGDEKRRDIERLLEDPVKLRRHGLDWDRSVGRLFQRGKHTISELIDLFLRDAKVVILRMGELSEHKQRFVMLEIFKTLKGRVTRQFKTRNETVNAMIVLDEAHRWVPQSSDDPIQKQIIDAVCTTRKYGLGWMFVTQRLATVHKEILSQAHTAFYGRNLGVGADRKHLEEALGRSGLQAYENLDMQGGFFWMAVGMDVNLGVGNTFMAFLTHGGDATAAIRQANPHIWR